MNRTILLDVDDVLLNCSAEVHKTAEEFFQASLPSPETWETESFADAMKLSKTQWRDFEAYLREKDDLATRFVWYQNALAFTERLASFGEVVFCTAPWVGLKHWYETRREALAPFLGRRGYQLVMTNQKHLVKGDILIDDLWKNIERTPERGILFAKPHNKKDQDQAERVAHDYTETLTMVAKWAK